MMTRLSVPGNEDDDTETPALPCAQKLAFDSRRQAAVAANVAEYQRGAQVAPYHCRYCDLWHLASQ